MLGWMMKRAAGGANAPETNDGDTMLADQPDTPAPVFAARAFKSALGFGGSEAARSDLRKTDTASTATATPVRSQPQGILLTPGTGTTRRKRVSFGHDVGSRLGSSQTIDRATDNTGPTRKRTRLGAALEANKKGATKKPIQKAEPQAPQDITDSEWEEEDDEPEVTGEMTTDFAEPRSESGKYWKQEFQRYRDDAKVEMDKMLKYKSLAKSYAKLKDAEAMELAEKLRAEQERVIAMEKKISESASTIVSQQKRSASEKSMAETVSKLTKQTALAIQYRQRVQELENELEDLVRSKEAGSHSDENESVTELRRELRNAQTQIRENERLKEQIEDLKTKLKSAKEESRSKQASTSDNTRTRELRAELREAKDEIRNKDQEIRQLRKEHTALQKQTETQQEEVKTLLARSQTRYAELKKEHAALKASSANKAHAAPSSRPKSWHAPVEESEEEADLPEETAHEDLHVDTPAYGKTAGRERSVSLRDKYRKDAVSDSPGMQSPMKALDLNSPKKTALNYPSSQTNVRRSLRNKKSIGELAPSYSAASSRPKSFVTPDIPVLDKVAANAGRYNRAVDGEVDLLKSQFARLGGPEAAVESRSTSVGNSTKTSEITAARRAAALARVQQSMEEKRQARAKTRSGGDKENLRPMVGA